MHTDSAAPAHQIKGVNPAHVELLRACLRAPSAHNAQPWQIKPLDFHRYELHYDQRADLPEDPNDKDAYLTMGALVETMVLQAPNFGLTTNVEPVLARKGRDFLVAKVTMGERKGGIPADPLSRWVDKRVTNRNSYLKDDLPPGLEVKLKELGNVLLEPRLLKGAVLEACMRGWANPRFVSDLRNWLRTDESARDGLSVPLMNLNAIDMLALRFAFWRGSFRSRLLQWLFSSSEVGMFASAPRVAVLTVSEMSPLELFEAGRRLLRSWVEITAAGYATQPYSVGVDDEHAAKKVGEVANSGVPVALYRIGKPARPLKTLSHRKPLSEVLLPPRP